MFYQNLILSLAAWLYHWSNQLLDHAEDLMVRRFIDQERKASK